MSSIFIITMIATSFFSPDKILHFTYSAGLTGLSNHIMQNQCNLKPETSRTLTISLVSTTGIGKEFFDLKKKKKFSIEDIFWDLAGIGVGYLLFMR